MTFRRQPNQEMSETSLQAWLQRIERVHPATVELGLERVARVASRLQLLPLKPRVITVAGTNGKGSVVAVLEALFQAAGIDTGTFTSPHLLRFNERIHVAGCEATDEEIIASFKAIEQGRGEIPLTYFEFATLAALIVFASRSPEVIILEVGLGGRLDSVNIVDPDVAVITSIDLDHQDWLGDTRDAIAREKAGILRPFTPVVIGEPNPPAALREAIKEVHARPALFAGKEFGASQKAQEWRAEWRRRSGEMQSTGPRQVGSLLPQNIATAVQAALLLDLDITEACLDTALSRASPMGRRQHWDIGGQEYILDVGHNPAAVSCLAEYLEARPCQGRTVAVFSVLADKDIAGIVQASGALFDAWFLADQPDVARSADAARVAGYLRDAGHSRLSISKNPRQALRRAQSLAGSSDRVVVFGSFHTVAAVVPLLQRELGKFEGL